MARRQGRRAPAATLALLALVPVGRCQTADADPFPADEYRGAVVVVHHATTPAALREEAELTLLCYGFDAFTPPQTVSAKHPGAANYEYLLPRWLELSVHPGLGFAIPDNFPYEDLRDNREAMHAVACRQIWGARIALTACRHWRRLDPDNGLPYFWLATYRTVRAGNDSATQWLELLKRGLRCPVVSHRLVYDELARHHPHLAARIRPQDNGINQIATATGRYAATLGEQARAALAIAGSASERNDILATYLAVTDRVNQAPYRTPTGAWMIELNTVRTIEATAAHADPDLAAILTRHAQERQAIIQTLHDELTEPYVELVYSGRHVPDDFAPRLTVFLASIYANTDAIRLRLPLPNDPAAERRALPGNQ